MSRTVVARAEQPGDVQELRKATRARVDALGNAALYVAAGLLLSLIVHRAGWSPRVLLPMHLTVLLSGMTLSPLYAALVGIMTPAISTGLTGAPIAEQTLRMIPELTAYGACAALVLRALRANERIGVSRVLAMMVALVAAMIAGRIVYTLMSVITTGVQPVAYYVSVLLVPAVPGLIVQLLLVPILAYRSGRSDKTPSLRR